MPDTAKVSEDFDASSGAQTATIDDATIESMSAKSGESVESIKKKLGLDSVTTDQANGDTLLAGKFKSEEALNDGIQNITDKLELTPEAAQKIIDALGPEKAYKHFEQELGAKAKPAKDADEEAEKDALSDPDDEDDALSDPNDADEDAGKDAPKIEWENLASEYAENGTLSEESIKELTKVVPEPFVNQYLEALGAQEELMTIKVHDVMGGTENYDTVIEWAKTGLKPAEKARFNEALNGTVKGAVDMATALKNRYEKINGTLTRTRLDGSTPSANAVNAYSSKEEMQRDMRDPRYKQGDPAFHAMVMRKLKNSKL